MIEGDQCPIEVNEDEFRLRHRDNPPIHSFRRCSPSQVYGRGEAMRLLLHTPTSLLWDAPHEGLNAENGEEIAMGRGARKNHGSR